VESKLRIRPTSHKTLLKTMPLPEVAQCSGDEHGTYYNDQTVRSFQELIGTRVNEINWLDANLKCDGKFSSKFIGQVQASDGFSKGWREIIKYYSISRMSACPNREQLALSSVEPFVKAHRKFILGILAF